MAKQVISEIPGRPKNPDPPVFSPVIKAGDFVFLTSRGGEGRGMTEEIEGQTRNCLEKVKATLQAADAALEDVVRVVIILKNPDDADKMNEVFQSYFPKDPPARTTHVGSSIHGITHRGLIEIECTAYCPDNK